jgi:hypothetical protein
MSSAGIRSWFYLTAIKTYETLRYPMFGNIQKFKNIDLILVVGNEYVRL